MEARDATRNLKPPVEGGGKQEDENGDDYDGGNGGNRNGGVSGNGGNGNEGNINGGVNGKGNGGGNGNGNDNGNGNRYGGGNGYNFGGFMPVARECTYQDFLKYQPLNFNGTKGVVGLTRWFEKMEKRAVGIEAAYAMTWTELMKLMIEARFEEFVLLCTIMVPDEEDKVKRFIGGLPDNIQGNKLKGYARNAKNKRRFNYNLRDNLGQQPAFKRQNVEGQNVASAYTAGNNERKGNDCPKSRNQIRRNKTGNKTGSNEATAKAYAIGGGGTNPDSNVVMGTFLFINCYTSMLLDSGADRSFVSSTFSALLDVAPSSLDTSYIVELANGRIS
ncbi:putative reverse transcriptase domain-containing protein [Tanacetum coccineum]|uniref:Reverse transcriptase domain-containing protein n=1 Tax=Tanacetum coccineum TaxID=301880 RepID=A0ABQ5HZB2_9ASTR